MDLLEILDLKDISMGAEIPACAGMTSDLGFTTALRRR